MTDVNRFGGYDDGPVFAEYYDHTPPYNGRPDIDFYRDLAASVGGKILELGCGTGRILIPSAVAGCRIVGLENSEFMIARCGAKLQNQPEEVQERVQLAGAT